MDYKEFAAAVAHLEPISRSDWIRGLRVAFRTLERRARRMDGKAPK